MDVQLSPDQKALARDAIQAGRAKSEEDVIGDALALWENRERARLEILLKLDEAESSLARGEGRVITQPSMLEMANDVKRRGRARFQTEYNKRG